MLPATSYISDGSNQLIREWNASTQAVTTLGSVSYPQTIAVDGSGNVYVVAAFQSIMEWSRSPDTAICRHWFRG